jgi:hypothetical protein
MAISCILGMCPPVHSPDTWAIVAYFVVAVAGVVLHLFERWRISHKEMPILMESADKRTAWDRFLAFIEQPFFLAPLGIIGGIVGVLVSTPVFLVCDACVLLALHRSKAVADKRKPVQWFWYCLVFIATTAILVSVGIALRNSARHFVGDVAKAVAQAIQPNMGQLPSATPQTQPQQQAQGQTQAQQSPTRETARPVPLNAYDLTGRRGELFLALLNTQLEPRDTLRVGCISWIAESCVAAGKFLLLFSQAGWKIDSNRVFRFDPAIPPEGVTIAAKAPRYTDNLPPHLGHWGIMDASQGTFWQTFVWMQIPVGASGDPDMPEGTIGVYFGPVPNNVNVRTAAQAQEALMQMMGLILIELKVLERTCPTEADLCKTKSLQWAQVVSVLLDYCDCGLDKSWPKRWKDACSDARDDRATIIARQDKALQRFASKLNKAKHK